jgi:hypothetical protein
MRTMRYPLALLAALVALALPPSSHASPAAVVRDCADDGTLQGSYANGDLRRAQDLLPTDLDEYSDCREVIGAAITAGPPKMGGGGAGGGHARARAARSPASARHDEARDRVALESLAGGGERPKLKIGHETVEPGENGLFDLASAANALPVPLLLALIALGVLAVAGAAYGLRRRIPALSGLSRISLPRVPLPRLRR